MCNLNSYDERLEDKLEPVREGWSDKEFLDRAIKTCHDICSGDDWEVYFDSIIDGPMRKCVQQRFTDFCWFVEGKEYSYEADVKAFIGALERLRQQLF